MGRVRVNFTIYDHIFGSILTRKWLKISALTYYVLDQSENASFYLKNYKKSIILIILINKLYLINYIL